MTTKSELGHFFYPKMFCIPAVIGNYRYFYQLIIIIYFEIEQANLMHC